MAEFEPDGNGGFATGRPIGVVEPIAWLYGDHGLDVLRCDGPGAVALTSAADVPDRVVVTDPETGGQVAVMTRDQALVQFGTQWASGGPPTANLVSKLVHLDDLGDLGDLSGLGEHPDQSENGLVWAVADPSETRAEITQLSMYGAVSGVWIRTGPIDTGVWLGLTDLGS